MTPPRGEKAKEADPDETARQDVQEKPPQKFIRTDGQDLLLTAVRVVFPSKGDGPVRDVHEPVIRDRHAVGVPREVWQDMLGSAEGGFGVDHPLLAKERTEEGAKRPVIGERLEVAREDEGAVCKRRPEAGDKLAAKHAAQLPDGQEEPMAGTYPPCAIGRESPDGNDAVDMRVVQQILSPGVEHTQKPNCRTEMPGARRDLEPRGRTRAKQEIVDDPLVLEGQPGEFVWQREHDMAVADGAGVPAGGQSATSHGRSSDTSGNAGSDTS